MRTARFCAVKRGAKVDLLPRPHMSGQWFRCDCTKLWYRVFRTSTGKMPLSLKRMLEFRAILTCSAVMCCFHVRLQSTRTPRNLAVVARSIGTFAMDAVKGVMLTFEKIIYLVFLTFKDRPFTVTQSRRASVSSSKCKRTYTFFFLIGFRPLIAGTLLDRCRTY